MRQKQIGEVGRAMRQAQGLPRRQQPHAVTCCLLRTGLTSGCELELSRVAALPKVLWNPLLSGFLDSSTQMLAQKILHGAVKLEAVLFVRKAVSFVGLYDVRYFDPSGLQRLNHLI